MTWSVAELLDSTCVVLVVKRSEEASLCLLRRPEVRGVGRATIWLAEGVPGVDVTGVFSKLERVSCPRMSFTSISTSTRFLEGPVDYGVLDRCNGTEAHYL